MHRDLMLEFAMFEAQNYGRQRGIFDFYFAGTLIGTDGRKSRIAGSRVDKHSGANSMTDESLESSGIILNCLLHTLILQPRSLRLSKLLVQ